MRLGAGGPGAAGKGRSQGPVTGLVVLAIVAVLVALAGLAGSGTAARAPTGVGAGPSRAASPGGVPGAPSGLSDPSGGSGADTAGLGPFRRAWVLVPVATVWNRPGTDRPEDAAAVSARPDVGRWVSTLDYRQKLGLDDLLATQALLDQPVFVYGHEGSWRHVLVLGQTGSVYPFGIAGWVPAAQLTYTAPPSTGRRAAVDVPVLAVGGLALSYGTEVPVAASEGARTTVILPDGRFAVPTAALRSGPLSRSGAAVVAQAERFVGLPYLWAGTSSFGYDCSGLTYSVYRSFGITLARDAADQARQGVAVARADLRPGDLVFFSFDGVVDHVGFYAGDGMMVDSPETGSAVEVVPLWGTPLSSHYAGARRYL